jgi:hypothetical protein
MVQCLSLLSVAAIRLQPPWELAIKNIIQYTLVLGTSRTLHVAATVLASFRVRFCLFRRVSSIFLMHGLDLTGSLLASKKERETMEYQKFCRQLYHSCLAFVYAPLKPYMTTMADIVRCPDGHFQRVIYSIGPYIADYPEQVWLSGIVQNWCFRHVGLDHCLLFLLRVSTDVMLIGNTLMISMHTFGHNVRWNIYSRCFKKGHLMPQPFGMNMDFVQILQ